MRTKPLLLVSLILLSATSCATATQSPATSSPASVQDAPREQTADQQVRHVLNRLAFGARPGDYERVRQMGVDAWIQQQLHPERIDDPAVTRLLAQLPVYTASVNTLVQEYSPPNPAQARTAADSMMMRQQNAAARSIIAELRAARVGRAVVSDRQLEEVLVDFWLNHFSVFAGKNGQLMRNYLSSYERDVVRPRVFGKFRDLVGAVAKSPAMLIYLDNRQSQVDSMHVSTAEFGAPAGRGGLAARGRGAVGRGAAVRPAAARQRGLNENYARELLELHTLGVDGGYTQEDVVEVARALTGWSIVPPAAAAGAMRAAQRVPPGSVVEGHFMFRPQAHDADRKKVLGVELPAGRGVEDGEQVLDIVARHPSTATHIATKLARRFVSDTPPASLVARAAATFRATDGDLRAVVRTIVTSPEFFSADVYRAKVKSPFEVVVSAMRAVGAPADATPRTAQLVESLGQPVFGRQTPDGWPETGDEWINTGAILSRINFGVAVAAGRVPGTSPAAWPLPAGIRSQPREKQVDAVIATFLGGEASPETRAVLMSGTNPLLAAAADTGDTMDTMANRRRPAQRGTPQLPALEGVSQIVGLALGSPEFQRR